FQRQDIYPFTEGYRTFIDRIRDRDNKFLRCIQPRGWIGHACIFKEGFRLPVIGIRSIASFIEKNQVTFTDCQRGGIKCDGIRCGMKNNLYLACGTTYLISIIDFDGHPKSGTFSNSRYRVVTGCIIEQFCLRPGVVQIVATKWIEGDQSGFTDHDGGIRCLDSVGDLKSPHKGTCTFIVGELYSNIVQSRSIKAMVDRNSLPDRCQISRVIDIPVDIVTDGRIVELQSIIQSFAISIGGEIKEGEQIIDLDRLGKRIPAPLQ